MFCRALERLGIPPLLNILMMSTQEYFRDINASKLSRSRIVRMVKQFLTEMNQRVQTRNPRGHPEVHDQ